MKNRQVKEKGGVGNERGKEKETGVGQKKGGE